MPDTQKKLFAHTCSTRLGFTTEHTRRAANSATQAAAPAGFALIIALVLMGFILLLVLSLGSLARVNIAGANLEQSSQYAQRNAVLALNIALGQLQQYAGADRHTSARADISAPSTDDDDEESPGFAHPYWTGVWGYDNGQFELQTYLVSGNQNPANPLELNASNAVIPESEAVTLLSATDAVTSTGEVIAQKVSIEEGNQKIGSYAYWISDEGVKAKVNLAQTPPASDAINNFPLISPHQSGVSQITNLSWFPMNDAQSIKALVDSGTLAVLASQSAGGDASAIHNHFHDVTLHSYGVLSDSKDGGLKRDLTVGLANGASAPSGQIFGRVAQRADYTGGSVSADNDPGGPTWNQLRSWVNTTLTNSNALPVRTATDEEVGYAPVIAGFQMYYVPTYHPSNLEVSMQVMPAVVLWNPYDVPLESADYRVRAGRATSVDSRMGAIYTSNQNVWILLQTGTNGSGGVVLETLDRFKHQITPRIGNPNNSNPAPESFDFFINNQSFAPGEAIVFSPTSNTPFFYSDTRVLGPGLRYYGYSTPLREGNSSGAAKRVLVMGDHDDNPATPPEPLTAYGFSINPTTTAGLQLFREDASGGSKVLSDILYLNHTRPASNTTSAVAYMATNPNTSAAIDASNAIGWKVVRRFSASDNGLFSDHESPFAEQKWLVDLNPRASTSGPNQLNYSIPRATFDTSTTANPSFVSLLEVEPTNMGISTSTGGAAFTGPGESGSISSTILFEASKGIDNLFSIGQLTHAPLYYWNDGGTNNAGVEQRIRRRMQSSRFDNLIPAYPLGNSRANPAIPLNSYYRNFGDVSGQQYFEFTGLLYDYSWLLNDALWDPYFFSSLISDGNAEAPTYAPRNPRIVPLPDATGLAPNWETSAAHLLVDGAFNINSTSVEAWKAILASFYGQTVQRSGTTDTHSDKSTFLRISDPASGALAATGSPTSQEAYDGYRTLDATQIDELAKAIVKQIKLRGPFPTLAEFVNRSLSAPAETQLQGALAAAIADTSINAALANSTYESTADSEVNLYNAAASAGHKTEGLPGWLTSADLLARLGSILTARSDTFLIRSYGEFINNSGETESKAWCEAIVQRLPYYVDSNEPPQTNPQALNSINEAFGRRFAIVSFRWLSEDEL